MKMSNKFRRNSLCILLCFVMLFATLLVGCNASLEENAGENAAPAGEQVEVVRLIADIAAGIKITEDKIEVVKVNKADLPVGTILAKEDVIGKFTVTDMYIGEYFLSAKLSNVRVNGSDNNGEGDTVINGELNFDDVGYVIVTDYVKPDTGTDVSAAIQKLIDENPNRTLYFPDGTYILSKPIETSADPAKSVSLKLANFAHFKPIEGGWTKGEPLFKLGAKDMAEGITNDGNHTSLEGGVFEGCNVADAIWVMNAGNVSIRYTSIKDAIVGIRTVGDADHNGPTVDVHTSNIVGSGTLDSIGVLLETNGNTLTNMRIASNQVAIKLTGADNFLRNLHPLYIYEATLDYNNTYNQSVAFWDEGTRNFYDNCYNDQFAIGFYIGKDTQSIYDCCFNFWYRGTNEGEPVGNHNAFVCEGQFNSVIRFTSADFNHANPGEKYSGSANCNFLLVGEAGGNGKIDNVYFIKDNVSADDVSADYMGGQDPIGG